MDTLVIAADSAWSPYLVGALIGILVCVSLLTADKPIGASSAYSVIAGIIAKKISPQKTMSMAYFQSHSTKMDWSLVFLMGIAIGGFLSAVTGSELTGEFLPSLWRLKFGSDSQILRAFTAVIGGVLLAVGARTAGGCTSGHGISGALQLSVASWVSLICFFVGGVVAAFAMYS